VSDYPFARFERFSEAVACFVYFFETVRFDRVSEPAYLRLGFRFFVCAFSLLSGRFALLLSLIVLRFVKPQIVLIVVL